MGLDVNAAPGSEPHSARPSGLCDIISCAPIGATAHTLFDPHYPTIWMAQVSARILSAFALLVSNFCVLANADRGTEPQIGKRLVLADFEQADPQYLAQHWRGLANRQVDTAAAGLSLETVELDGKPNKVLRFNYALPSQSPVGQPLVEAVLRLEGVDASGYDHLTFRVRGDGVAGFSPNLKVGFRRLHDGIAGMEEVSRATMAEPVKAEWQTVVIPLKQMVGIINWSHLSEFSLALLGRGEAVRRGSYLLDDIALVKTGQPSPAASDEVATPAKDAWVKAQANPALALKQRLVAWPGRVLVDPQTLPADDRAFLWRLALDTWRGLDGLSDKENGLPIDRVHLGDAPPSLEGSLVGDYTSSTNIGLHFLAVVSAYELKFIDRGQALARLRTTLASLERMETYQGFYYNYYNTITLERTSNLISFVDSSWLTAGLIVARQAFPELAGRCGRLINQADYRFFHDPARNLMSHGYYVNLDVRSAYHFGTLYTEARLGSLMAMGKGDVPASHWFALARTFPKSYDWQVGEPLNRQEKSAQGFNWTGGYYQWKDYRYVPSWGGSLFEALMPVLVMDEQRYAPDSLGKNDAIHTEIQRRYALEELSYPVWGMSPSSIPGSDWYTEYGVEFLGMRGYPSSVVTPHAAALALLTEPEQATANLRQLARRYPLYGDYGFYDAVNPKTGQVAYKYLCLNQAMILAALANHLADHALQKHFAADPLVRNILPVIGIEKFFN